MKNQTFQNFVNVSEIPLEPSFKLIDGRNNMTIPELDFLVNTVCDAVAAVLDPTNSNEAAVPFIVDMIQETDNGSIEDIHRAP